jgi:hypothetical protein
MRGYAYWMLVFHIHGSLGGWFAVWFEVHRSSIVGMWVWCLICGDWMLSVRYGSHLLLHQSGGACWVDIWRRVWTGRVAPVGLCVCVCVRCFLDCDSCCVYMTVYLKLPKTPFYCYKNHINIYKDFNINSIEQGHSSEANSSSTSQDITSNLWNLQVYYTVHHRTPCVPLLQNILKLSIVYKLQEILTLKAKWKNIIFLFVNTT